MTRLERGFEAMVGHIETVMANLGETLDRYEMESNLGEAGYR